MQHYNTSDTSRIIGEQVKRIHASIHDGTLDKGTIDDALGKLSNLAAGVGEPATPPAYGKKSDAQNRAAPTPHAGEPGDGFQPNGQPNQPVAGHQTNDGRPVQTNDGRPVQTNDGRVIQR